MLAQLIKLTKLPIYYIKNIAITEEVILNEERTTDEEKMKIIEGNLMNISTIMSRMLWTSKTGLGCCSLMWYTSSHVV